jgi:hypothetical protein
MTILLVPDWLRLKRKKFLVLNSILLPSMQSMVTEIVFKPVAKGLQGIPKKSIYGNHSFVVKRGLFYFWEFKIASKTNSNTKMSNYKFVLPSVRVRMVQLTTEQRVIR